MNRGEKLRRRRWKLFGEQKGQCYWCKCDMVLMWSVEPKAKPGNLATVDHLRDRFDETRREPARGDQRLVAACYDCNFRRGVERQAAQPIDELWRRAGHSARMSGK